MKSFHGKCQLSSGHFSPESQNPTVFTLNVKSSIFGQKHKSLTKKSGNKNLTSVLCIAFYHKITDFSTKIILIRVILGTLHKRDVCMHIIT